MPTSEGVFPKVGGDPLYYSEANLLNGIFQFYSGTGFNTGGAGAGSTFAMNFIPPNRLTAAKFVKFNIIGNVTSTHAGGQTEQVMLAIQYKPSGGTYADDMPLTELLNNGATTPTTLRGTWTFYHPLSSGDIGSGVYFQIIGSSINTGAGQAIFSNNQTTMELC